MLTVLIGLVVLGATFTAVALVSLTAGSGNQTATLPRGSRRGRSRPATAPVTVVDRPLAEPIHKGLPTFARMRSGVLLVVLITFIGALIAASFGIVLLWLNMTIRHAVVNGAIFLTG